MAAVQEDSVDLASEANIAIVERLLFLLEQVRQLLDLLLQRYDLLPQESVIFPLDLSLATAVDGQVGWDGSHHVACRA